MTSTKPALGTILNKEFVTDRKSGPVKASTILGIGLVKETALGWDNAGTSETDGSILYWNDKVIDNSAGAVGAKEGTFYKKGARVIGKSDGIIAVGAKCKAGTAVAQAFIVNATPANATTPTGGEVDAVRNWVLATVANYVGHALEVIGVDTLGTASADLEEDCVFEMI